MGWHYEDFEPGHVIETPGRTVTEADIGAFAGVSGDFNSLHTNEVFAVESGVGGRIAHGPMVLGMAFGLGARAGLFDETVLGLLGVQWTFQAPVRPGDTLRASIAVLEMRPTRKPDRGIVSLRFDLRNQHRVQVQTGHCQIMFKRRPVAA
ncbi:MAG: paaZ 3 [Variovorax sp.]|nr:paaZ 3 [Variovorax sp.]